MAGPIGRDFYPRAVIVCACHQRLRSTFPVIVVLLGNKIEENECIIVLSIIITKLKLGFVSTKFTSHVF